MKFLKQILLLFFLTFLASCSKEKDTVRLYKWGGGYIEYKETIGYDFNSALDSLLRREFFRPQEPYIIVPEPVTVEYPDDDRVFFWIAFKDTTGRYYLASPSNVLDTKGCWYRILFPED